MSRITVLVVASVLLLALALPAALALLSGRGPSPEHMPRPLAAATLAAPSGNDPEGWRLKTHRGTIAGFADRVSASNGESIALFVTTPAPFFSVQVFRLGWYDNGARAAELVTTQQFPGRVQPAPLVDQSLGLVSAANWSTSGVLAVDGWRSGLYLLKLTASDGDQSYIPLVVRDELPHDLLFEHAATTDQAYNNWGGKSLYEYNSSPQPTLAGTRAVKVSFDRPYDGDGSGQNLLRWELNMVRWLEASGFDVGYVSDLDLHREPALDARARAIVQAGHNEYWSKEMRDHLEAARARGTGLGFFTGDTGAWAIRFEPSRLGRDRVLVCYKSVDLDPLAATDPPRVTTRWAEPPLNRPTQALLGLGSNAAVKRSADWEVVGASDNPEVFAGTGLRDGDVVPNLVGYEYDSLWAPGAEQEPPPGARLLGRARVEPTRPLTGMLHFRVGRFFAPEAQPRADRLATWRRPGQPGTFGVRLVSSAGHRLLEYAPGGTALRGWRGDVEYAVVPLDADPDRVAWVAVERDLRRDYAAAFGAPAPPELRVVGLEVRGSLALAPVRLADPDGGVTTVEPGDARSGGAGWQLLEGKGVLEVLPVGPGGQLALATTDQQPGYEAHTVLIRAPGAGPVVAVGSIQWSWALDEIGQHVDEQGHPTAVDPRIQALTRNLLRLLLG